MVIVAVYKLSDLPQPSKTRFLQKEETAPREAKTIITKISRERESEVEKAAIMIVE